MRIALVHDYLIQYGGAERVLEELFKIYPEAPLYTTLYQPETLPPEFRKKVENRKVFTSLLQNKPGAKNHHKFYLAAMPYAVEQWDLSEYDLVLSDSSSFAKGVISPPESIHISYCHTPLRYVWDLTHHYQRNYPFPKILRPFVPLVLQYLRFWDRQAGQRPDQLICNSSFVQKRIKKYYNRNSQIIPPPVSVSTYLEVQPQPQDYFLVLARLIPYKKIKLAIKAFNKLGQPLKIIGDGPQAKELKAQAQNNIEFLGRVYGEKLIHYYSHCKAFVLPQKEDFGIAPIEAMACGRPVIAYKAGGALDYIQPKQNGVFFQNQTPNSLIKTIKQTNFEDFHPQTIKKSVRKFDQANFRSKIKKLIAKKTNTQLKDNQDET